LGREKLPEPTSPRAPESAGDEVPREKTTKRAGTGANSPRLSTVQRRGNESRETEGAFPWGKRGTPLFSRGSVTRVTRKGRFSSLKAPTESIKGSSLQNSERGVCRVGSWPHNGSIRGRLYLRRREGFCFGTKKGGGGGGKRRDSFLGGEKLGSSS